MAASVGHFFLNSQELKQHIKMSPLMLWLKPGIVRVTQFNVSYLVSHKLVLCNCHNKSRVVLYKDVSQ